MLTISREAIDRALCEKSFFEFIRQSWHVVERDLPYEHNWHVPIIASHLQAVATGDINRLILNLCPGLGKSRYSCVYFPAWVWTFWPSCKFLVVSYSEEFAKRDSKLCRELIGSSWYQSRWGSRVIIRSDSDTQLSYANTETGSRTATSITGGGTGSRTNISIFDDLMKIEDADRQVIRDQANSWLDMVATGRGIDPRTYRMINVQQRLHWDDQSGHLMRQGGWQRLHMPMEFSEAKRCKTYVKDKLFYEDPRKEDGELLWPERFTPPIVASEKMKYGHKAAAIINQDPPRQEEGVLALFDKANFRYFEKSLFDGRMRFSLLGDENVQSRYFWADECRWFQTADTAMKVEEQHDYTVVGTFCVTPQQDLLVYDIYRTKIAIPHQFNMLFEQRKKYPQSLFMGIEDKGSGIGLVQEAQLRGMPFRPLKAEKDKFARCGDVSTKYLNHQVYHLRDQSATWLPDFEIELLDMDSRNDDQRDVLAYAGLLQSQDAILRAAFSGDGVLYPQVKLNDDGTIKQEPKRGVYYIGGHEIEWPEDED